MINSKSRVIISLEFFSLLLAIGMVLAGNGYSQDRDVSSIVKVDYKELVSRADIIYRKPVSRSEEGLPIGNGRMGSLAWTTPNMLRFQINRVDVFGNNSASDNFFERNSDYCGGLGFVDIDFANFGESVFTEDHFKEYLSCYNGNIGIEGKGIKARVTTWNKKDVMAIEIQDNRANPKVINTKLRMLRPPVSQRGDHMALSTISSDDGNIILTQKFTEDDYYCRSALVISSSGRKVEVRKTSEREIQLSIAAGRGKFSIFIGSATTFDPDEDAVASATRQVNAATEIGFEGVNLSTKQWWHNFWEKGFIQLHSDDEAADLLEKNYTYYLYVMASSSRGKYPVKFNGMLWTTGGDARKWGSAYWGANQSCLYNPLFATNRMELMDPMFHMYSAMRQSCSVAARQQWNSKGIYIPETVAFNGMPKLPENIAGEMQDLYLLKKPWGQRSKTFNEYASTKMPFLSRWNWKSDQGWKDGKWHFTDKGSGPFGHVTHIFSRGAKIAYKYWLKYEYMQDKEWLRNEAYPMLKGVSEFYRNFPHIRLEKDGRYHIRNINDNESIWGGHNTIEEISAMKGILPVAIKASNILNVDVDLRRKWQSLFDHLSPLPTGNVSQSSNALGKQGNVWIKSLQPIVRGNGNRLPDPNTMPVWFFDLCTLESDSAMLEMANRTYDGYFREGINSNTRVNVLSKLPVSGVELGRTDAAKYLIENQIQTKETAVMSNRMDLREGYQTTSIQRLGRAADALQKSLLQSVPPEPGGEPVIHVFPAWPKEWDAQYRLLSRGNFLVSSSMQGGEIKFVKIFSKTGSRCRLRNQWLGNEVDIYRNGRFWKKIGGETIDFHTRKNDRYVIKPAGGG